MALTAVLIHGAGSHSATMVPIAMQLQRLGYTNIINVGYDCSGTLEESIASVSSKIEHAITTPLLVIGHSLGGVIGYELQKRQAFRVHHLITIASPLHGSRLAKRAASSSYMPTRTVYKCLADRLDRTHKPPKCTYNTISCGWFGSQFDLCVWSNEAQFEPHRHKHFYCHDHRMAVVSPFVLAHLASLLATVEEPEGPG
jgi:pimeloyl-ACP methyl ester carboxylesterase